MLQESNENRIEYAHLWGMLLSTHSCLIILVEFTLVTKTAREEHKTNNV